MEDQGTQDSQLLDSLYSAAGDHEAWNHFLARVAQRLDAAWTGLISVDPSAQGHSLNFKFGVPDEATRLYEHHYAAIDPWFLAYRSSKLRGWTGKGSTLCPPSEFERTEFYTDFFRLLMSITSAE